MYKLFHFNLTMSPLYLVKLKITQKQQSTYEVHSVEPIVPDFRRKSLNVYQKFIYKLNMGNFNM